MGYDSGLLQTFFIPLSTAEEVLMTTILEEYIAQHPGSAQRYAEAVQIFPGGVTHDNRYAQPFPLYITHGTGPRKWDVDGNEYIDYISGHGALILGHSHPAIAAAVAEQINRGTHLGACTDEEVRWARAIKALMPSIEKVRFHSSGTEATLMAMRLARAYTGKNKVIKLQDHFHGWHDYAMAGSDRSAPGIPEETWGSMAVAPSGDLKAVEQVLTHDPDIAALILEPTGAHYGQLPFDTPNFLKGLRELTARHGVVLIFDEVVTGFRASPGGAQVRYGVSPDLTTMAKIVAGALPGGAMGGKAEIIDMIAHRGDPEWDNQRRVYHPGTFNANPLSAVAGATCLEMIASQLVNQQADAMAERLKTGLNEIFGRMEVSGHAHGIASMIHMVLTDCDCDREICTMPHRQIKEVTASPAVTALKRGLQNNGIDIMGRDAFLVSATHTEKEINETLEAFEKTLSQVRAEGLV
jgi:glutamate-1-semialdehyde 2,1-aminomutase